MGEICPCCEKELSSAPAQEGQAEADMDLLFSCDHCQSVLKWENQALKVVFESKEEPSISPTPAEPPAEPEPEPPVKPEAEEGLLNSDQVNSDQVNSAVLADTPQADITDDPLAPPAIEQSTEGLPSAKVDNLSDEPYAEEFLSADEENTEDINSLVEEGQPLDTSSPVEGQPLDTSSPVEGTSLAGEGIDTQNDGELASAVDTEGPNEAENFEELAGEELSPSLPTEETPAGGEGVEEGDFADVQNYGNATSLSGKGFLLYDLKLEGIDSSEIKADVKSALEDPRFNWSAKELLQSEKEGVLNIQGLNPVKVGCLVTKLSQIPIMLSWRQYRALNSPTPDTEEEEAESTNQA